MISVELRKKSFVIYKMREGKSDESLKLDVYEAIDLLHKLVTILADKWTRYKKGGE